MSVKEAVISVVASAHSGQKISPLDVVQLYDSMADALITCFGAIAANKRSFVLFYGKIQQYDRNVQIAKREGRPEPTKPPAAIEFDSLVRTIQSEMQDISELAELPKKMGVRWAGGLPAMIQDMPNMASNTIERLNEVVKVLRDSDSMRAFPTAPVFFDYFRVTVIESFIEHADLHFSHLSNMPESQQKAFRKPLSKVLALTF